MMHTPPNQPRNNITFRIAGNTTPQLNNFAYEIASEHGSVAKCVGVKCLDWMVLAINSQLAQYLIIFRITRKKIHTISRVLCNMRYLNKHLIRFRGWYLDVLSRELWELADRDADDDGCVGLVSGHVVIVFSIFR